MKATGIVREIDKLGRIVIPKELRRIMGIDPKDPIEIFMDGDQIVLKPYVPCCIFCDSNEQLVEVKGKKVCLNCIRSLKQHNM